MALTITFDLETWAVIAASLAVGFQMEDDLEYRKRALYALRHIYRVSGGDDKLPPPDEVIPP